MSSSTRWAGVPLDDRRAERRGLLVDAAFALFGDGGESALTVRSVCRECGMNTRYFYESFTDTDELLGAVFDKVAVELGAAVDAAMTVAGDSPTSRTRAGIAAVLGFSSADPRRGRVLFTDARANPVLTARRAALQDALLAAVLEEGSRLHPGSDPVATRVGAAMFTGAMAELAQQYLSGALGDDLDAVVSDALRFFR
ncbi:TetR/AcrR family transcriptional regulator [Mycolicibacterium diernhoferi]|uniref:TetR family transcriptional regulator n=1 Tax=Mycolicibacterium diernhoferi TaxID=1801 RepID=A0A1Q4HBZ1_9MYCO|nr:helix-turn-helix domain-containing protein [Mycolicibacterium diernhoferi]OJZ65040.1 TetR family transcriptional regulator [Mycolicibacterium diernhoferi]OPE49084.1 TetR family transcriptional regulator [Mycolicibacterium diernhoferi]PEG52236.1 TetR/AcrR family transcriptional regulator [Mycolicibacterium diernhoferi]QYL23752.1 TetR/AcrR family transcriptional regulator [Mycolicibacterium diernhoferi]